MTPVRFLADTSALVRLLRDEALRARWQEQITAGLVAVCPIVELELLHSTRSRASREELVELLGTAFAWVSMPDQAFARAAEVQAALTDRATHRSAGAVDLLVAAAAELHRLALLHYDHDFHQVSLVTGQPVAWLAPPGSIS